MHALKTLVNLPAIVEVTEIGFVYVRSCAVAKNSLSVLSDEVIATRRYASNLQRLM